MNNKEANNLINILSDATRNFIASRTLLESNLFPVRSYMALGLYNLFEQEYDLIKKITKKKTPEELGKESKKINSEINQKTQFSLIVGYLVGREQVIMDGNIDKYGDKEHDAKKINFLFDFWKRYSKTYRNDKKLLVRDSNDEILILDRNDVEEVNDDLISVDDETKNKILRMAAYFQSYLYLANFESRGGVFNHGPYPVDDEYLVVREFVHLGKNTYGDISQERFPLNNLAIAMRLKDVEIKINEIGTIFLDPVDYLDNIAAINLFTQEKTLKKVKTAIVDRFSKITRNNMMKLFLEIRKWSRRQKILAGALQYSDLTSYSKSADIDYKRGLTDECMELYLPQMIKRNAHPFMKKFSSKEQLFSPIS